MLAAAAALMAGAGLARAQHQGHQMAPAGDAVAPDKVAACSQGARAVSATLDAAYARIEDARQKNNAAAMRAAMGDLQVAVAQMKVQLADCVALAASPPSGMSGMPGMSGMDHSKMPGMDHSKMPGMTSPARAQESKTPSASSAVTIALRSQPTPPRVGENEFEVRLTDREGKPIADAAVSLDFHMPSMPTMKMPEMRQTVDLAPAGGGEYRGRDRIDMAGDWMVTITATRKGRPLGTRKLTVTVKGR